MLNSVKIKQTAGTFSALRFNVSIQTSVTVFLSTAIINPQEGGFINAITAHARLRLFMLGCSLSKDKVERNHFSNEGMHYQR